MDLNIQRIENVVLEQKEMRLTIEKLGKDKDILANQQNNDLLETRKQIDEINKKLAEIIDKKLDDERSNSLINEKIAEKWQELIKKNEEKDRRIKEMQKEQSEYLEEINKRNKEQEKKLTVKIKLIETDYKDLIEKQLNDYKIVFQSNNKKQGEQIDAAKEQITKMQKHIELFNSHKKEIDQTFEELKSSNKALNARIQAIKLPKEEDLVSKEELTHFTQIVKENQQYVDTFIFEMKQENKKIAKEINEKINLFSEKLCSCQAVCEKEIPKMGKKLLELETKYLHLDGISNPLHLEQEKRKVIIKSRSKSGKDLFKNKCPTFRKSESILLTREQKGIIVGKQLPKKDLNDAQVSPEYGNESFSQTTLSKDDEINKQGIILDDKEDIFSKDK